MVILVLKANDKSKRLKQIRTGGGDYDEEPIRNSDDTLIHHGGMPKS
jgi:hypothetical protein